MKEITRYFDQNAQEQILEVRTLSIDKQYNFFRQKRELSLVYDKLWITVDDKPDSVTIKGDLFLLHFIGSNNNLKGATLQQIKLTNYDNNYQVMISPEAIVDCCDLKIKEFVIDYSIHGIKEKGGVEITVSDQVLIHMHKAAPGLSTTFEFAESDRLKFVNSDRVLLGNLCVLNNTAIRYAENLDLQINLRYNEKFDTDIVFWGDTTDITESNPFFDVGSGLRHRELQSILGRSIDADELSLNNIVAQNEIRIPVYIDMQRIGNPILEPLNTSFGLSIKNLKTKVIENKIISFSVEQDPQQTQLLVTVNGQDVLNGDELNLGLFKWIEFRLGTQNRFEGGSDILKLQIGNAATSVGTFSDAAVVVRNFRIGFTSESETGNAIIGGLTKINGFALDEVVKFFNAPDAYDTICYELEHNKVVGMKENRVNIVAQFEFDYLEDVSGEFIPDETPMQHFSAMLRFDVENDPGSDWLCVDYGTSASVAAFGDGSYKNTFVLNLDERLLELLQNLAPRMQSPRFEEGTPFLSSNVIFRDLGVLNTKYYDKRLMWLSPSEPQFQGNGMMLPYMKALVGYRHLPNASSYSNLRYKMNQEDKEVCMAEVELPIERIFKATYSSLFHDFILPTIKKLDKKANKLVLTVPNTYTPRHMDYIRRIVIETLPEIRPEYIWFVSESDAIACYYINKWHQLNSDRPEQEKDQLRNKGEHILAFDMGAGTLDITYFSIEPDDEECKKLEIKAKIGLNKAGNYLDYILAQVLVATHNFPQGILSPNDVTFQMLASKLKHFIKTQLKVSLFTDNEIVFKEWNGQQLDNFTYNDLSIDLQKIREHRLIEEFINETTHSLLDNFFEINGYEEGSTPIDTVVMAGRSIQFGKGKLSIENSVMDAVQRWNGGASSYKLRLQGDVLKTIVSEGALYFATIYSDAASIVKIRNRNLYASYGVVYTKPDGKTAYYELLNTKTKPIKSPNLDDNSTNGVYIYQYDTDRYNAHDRKDVRLDLRGGSTAYFVQSYSNDTAQDWDAKRRDLITEMFPFNTRQAVASASELKSVPVRIVVNADGEMLFYAGMIHDEATAPLRIDVTDNKSFNESMWPYL